MTFFFSWPVVALALICSSFGLIYRMPAPLVGTALLISPIAYYLGASPRFPWCFALPLIPLLAALALKKGHRAVAISLTVILFGFLIWILVLIDRARQESHPMPDVGLVTEEQSRSTELGEASSHRFGPPATISEHGEDPTAVVEAGCGIQPLLTLGG